MRHRPLRIFLFLAIGAVSTLLGGGTAIGDHIGSTTRQLQAATANAIQIENAKPGTPGWDDFASVAQQDAISGYGSKISVNHGDSLDLYVTTTAASFTMDVLRTGWYGGVGARLVQSLGSFPGIRQPIPAPNAVTGMVSAANWTKTTTLNIPSTWVTGVYLAKLSASNGNKSFIFFVVRNDGGSEPIDFQTSVTTYQAYNDWGGVSLYTNNTNNSVYRYPAATKVSFDRPFNPEDSNGAGQFLYFEYPFIRWAESQGYDITYTTDVDTHTNVNPLTNHRVFLSVGHDEYWTKGMRDNVTNAISQGVNAAFFSANSAYWQIRLEPNAAGAQNRVEVGYKESATFNAAPGPDPQWGVNNSVVTTRWRQDPVNLPENSFIGVMYQDQVQQNYAYVVQNASNWIYAGTGFTNGTRIPGIVGYEYDKVWNNGFSPPGLTVLSNSPVVGCCEGSGSSFSNSTLYTAPGGGQVFASGTIQWSWGLDNYNANFANAGIQKTTSNILNAFSAGSAAPAPSVSLSPTSLTFAAQGVGSTSTAQAVTLTNTGNAALSISSIGLTGTNAGDFTQTGTNCPIGPATLAAGGNCTISVAFRPSAAGARTAALSITDNAPGSPQSVSLSGTGTAPAVTLTPTSLTFSGQTVGTTSAPQSTTLRNTGTAPLTISSIGLAGSNSGDFSLTSTCPLSPITLGANSTCTISVVFTPSATGSRTASVAVADDAAGSPQSVALSGTGLASAPAVTLTPTSLTFAAQGVGTTSSVQTSTVRNTGTAALTINTIGVTGANSSDFSQTNDCPTSPASLAANSTCTISVTFSPSATGSRSASVTIADNAADTPQALGLTGTGVAPAVSLTPSALTFAAQIVGTSSPAKTSILRNTGSAPLTINTIAITGTNAGDFNQTNDCPTSPSTLAVNATCTISVTFSPSATGASSAGVGVADNAAGSPQSITLSGSGAAAAPSVDLTPTSLAFGSQLVGTTSSEQTTTLRNTGTAPLTIGSISVAGTNAANYAQTNTCPTSPATLAANATCTISVSFSPSATGSRTANLAIADDAADSPQTVPLTGTGAAPAATVTPSSVIFASQLIGTTSAAQSITIRNSGNAPLTITSVALAGANSGDYGLSSSCPLMPLTLAAGATCIASVTFSPSAAGTRNASLTVTDDAADSPQSAGLTGTGTSPAPAVSLTPASLAFGSQLLGTTSTAQSVTLRNTGTGPLTIASIALGGTNSGDYRQTNACPISPATLGTNATCTVSVTFAPTAAGSRAATLTVASDAAGSPHATALTGTGTTTTTTAIAFDKSLGTKADNVGTASMTLTTNAAAVAHSRLLLFVNWNHSTRTLTSVSGGGLTWAVDQQVKDASNNHAAIASADAPNGLPSGTVLTATFSGSVTHGLIAAASFTGIASVSPVDTASNCTQGGVVAWTCSVTTVNANDLVVAWSGIDANATSIPTAPNSEIHDFGDANYYEWSTSTYRIVATNGAKTMNGTWSRNTAATANVTVVVAYRGG